MKEDQTMTKEQQDLLNLGGEDGHAVESNTDTLPDNNTAGGTNDTPPAGSGTDADLSKSFKDSWKDYIPEELKTRSEWNNIKDPSDLFKNYINAQQMISKSVRIPDAASSPEDIANFYAKLGKPSAKEDYTFEYNPAKKEYIYNKDSFDFGVFQDIADKANLTKDQYQALAAAYIDINNENYLNYNQYLQQQAAEELKNAENKLKADWGSQYNQNINAITEKVKVLYPEDTLKRMQKAGLFRDPDFLSSHLKLTKMMTGDTVFIEGNAVENVPQTLQTLQEKRDRLMQDDYSKNRDQVLALNQQIVKLKQSQSIGATKFHG